MNRFFVSFFLAGVLLCVSGWSLQAQDLALVGGTVHPVHAPKIEGGVVIFEDGEITEVGAREAVSVPDGIRTVDVTGKVVTPGLIDAETSTGLIEVSSVSSTRDNALDGSQAIRAAFRVTDGINPNSVVIPITRLGGVTTVVSTPSGGAVSGQGAVIDLLGETVSDLLVEDQVAMYANFNPSGTSNTGGVRGGLAMRLREAFEDARFFDEHQDNYQQGATRDLTLSRLDLKALQSVLDGEMPLVVRASRASDIDAALRLAREFDLELLIEGGEEAWMRAEALAEADVPVIVKPFNNLPVEFDRLGSRFDNAAQLQGERVSVIISTFDTHNARNLRFEAGNAVRYGMEWTAALKAVTLAPAEALGIDETHGTLEEGKIANIVVWSGDPFEPTSTPERVFIRGEEIEEDSRQKRLLRRYRDMEERPPQYDDGSFR